MEYKVINYKLAPKIVQEWINKNKEINNYTVLHTKTKTYIIVTMGTKKTGGYEIEIISIEEQTDILDVKLKYIVPSADQIVIQMLTYPYLIIQIDRTSKKIHLLIDK